MPIFALFFDADLTMPVGSGTPLLTEHNASGLTGNVDVHLYFGSADETKKAEANSGPGLDQILLSIADTAAENGHASTVMSLANTQGDLDAAVPGAPLALGAEVVGGAAGAVDVWVRVNEGAQPVATWSDLELQTSELKITAI